MLALKIDDRVGIGHLLLASDQVRRHLLVAENMLKLLEGDVWVCLGVREGKNKLKLLEGDVWVCFGVRGEDLWVCQ